LHPIGWWACWVIYHHFLHCSPSCLCFSWTSLWLQGFMWAPLPFFLLWLFLEMGAHEIHALHQKHWNIKINESLRKEMNSMVVSQFLSMNMRPQILSQALEKTKLNKMTQRKKKWTKEIEVLIKHIKIGLPVLFLLVSSWSYLPISKKPINNIPTMAIWISKVKDDYITQYQKKNFSDPGPSHLSY
jgi:hypothetical protein